MQLDFSNKPIAAAAMKLAVTHHHQIKRKFTGEPYINHPIRVAELVLGGAKIVDQEVLAAALLHDCLEDEDVNGRCMRPEVIREHCGERVLRWIRLLSNDEKGSRAQRKAAAASRIVNAPSQVQVIKLADIIDNCTGIAEHDPRFAELYLGEKRDMAKLIPAPVDSVVAAMRSRALDVIAAEQNKLAVFALQNGQQIEAQRVAEEQEILAILVEEENREYAEVALF